MSNEVYAVWEDKMRQPNAGALGTPEKPIVDVVASVLVPDGLWAVFGKIEVNNNSSNFQSVKFTIAGDGGPLLSSPSDSSMVKLGRDGTADYASLALMILLHFPGSRTKRVNKIFLGLWDTGFPPDITMGRAKIIAMRVNHFIMEPSHGTTNQ